MTEPLPDPLDFLVVNEPSYTNQSNAQDYANRVLLRLDAVRKYIQYGYIEDKTYNITSH